MPNSFAYIVLYSFPLVVILLFRVLPLGQALVWSIVGGYLFLPERTGINFPVLPTIDKTLIPSLSAAVMCLLLAKATPSPRLRAEPARGTVPTAPESKGRSILASRAAYTRQREVRQTRSGPVAPDAGEGVTLHRRKGVWIGNALLLLLLAGPFFTVMTNSDPYHVGPKTLSELKLYDAFSMDLSLLVSILPFLLGRAYLATPERHTVLLRVFCGSGLIYSLLALIEVRISPQLNIWVYGFLPQTFRQILRGDGYRPVVFLHHGLWLGIFMVMVTLAAFALWRQQKLRGEDGGRYLLAGLWLGGVLFLCHSLGAFAILLGLLPFIVFAGIRGQLIMAAIVAATILTYPMLRGAGLIPVDKIHAIAVSISPARAESLDFRLENEDILLAHANEKPVFGWGGWGRSRVYDPVTGEDISTTDGAWIIIIGGFGWAGYIAQFGLLTIPILLLARRRRQLEVSLATAGLCLMLTANLIDMIMNGTLTPLTWLVAGALMGRYGLSPQAVAVSTEQSELPVRSRRTRTQPA